MIPNQIKQAVKASETKAIPNEALLPQKSKKEAK